MNTDPEVLENLAQEAEALAAFNKATEEGVFTKHPDVRKYRYKNGQEFGDGTDHVLSETDGRCYAVAKDGSFIFMGEGWTRSDCEDCVERGVWTRA
jgi:hypothetical protein